MERNHIMKVVCDTAMSKRAENKEAATTAQAALKGHLGQKLASKSQFPSWFKREGGNGQPGDGKEIMKKEGRQSQ